MNATSELKNEHQGIDLMLKILKAVSDKMGRGEQVDIDHLNAMMDFFSTFVDKCHHGKEEEFLFPALEHAGVGRQGGPVGVMLHEHAEGRSLIADLKAAIDGLQKKDQTAAKKFQTAADNYIALLTQHILKENNVLFAMADARLDDAQDTELMEAFEQLEQERIGPGRHEQFHALLNQLRDVYL